VKQRTFRCEPKVLILVTNYLNNSCTSGTETINLYVRLINMMADHTIRRNSINYFSMVY